jgi:hypothetical protein
MKYDIRFVANPSSDIGQRMAYGEMGSLLIGNKAGSAGKREAALRLRQAIRHTMA